MSNQNKKTITLIGCGDPPNEGEYCCCFDNQRFSAIKTVQNGDYYVTEKRFSSVEDAEEWLSAHTLSDFFCFGQISKM